MNNRIMQPVIEKKDSTLKCDVGFYTDTKRLGYLDLCKAIAILLVIFYHSISLLPISNEKINIISTLIEPFHVSSFYFISGFLFANSLIKFDRCGEGYKCIVYFIKYLLIFFIWGIIQGSYIFLIIKGTFLSCLIQGFYNYWFFPVLVLGYFFVFIIYKFKLKWFIVCPIWFFFFFLIRNSSMLMRIMFFPFLMYLAAISRDLHLSCILKLLICCLLYTIISTILLHFGYDSTYNGKTGFIAMAGFLNLIPGSMILPLLFEFINTKKEIILSSFFNFIGQNTLYIYIIHYFFKLPLVNFSSYKGWTYFIFVYLSIIFGTLLLVFLYRKLNKFMLKYKML